MDATEMPFRNEFDVVGAFDVLEHVEADERVVRGVHEALRPEGLFIVTVPQYQWMWSTLDEVVHHRRRYAKSELLRKVTSNGFDVLFCSAFVTVLFPVMALSRLFERTRVASQDVGQAFASHVALSRTANFVCDWVMKLDEIVIGAGIPLPFGGSLLIVARKR
jgi:SAM-dependent methyltransferase